MMRRKPLVPENAVPSYPRDRAKKTPPKAGQIWVENDNRLEPEP
jgi:hypothetical protein